MLDSIDIMYEMMNTNITNQYLSIFSLICKLWRERNEYYVMLYFAMIEFHKTFNHDVFINQRKPRLSHLIHT